MLRLDEEAFGAPRAKVLEALQAEGIPCSGGYGWSLPRQPLFTQKAFGPYLSGAAHRLDYAATTCPVSDRLCREAIWLEHRLFLGSPDDVDDIASAFEKVHAHREALRGAVETS
jgi:dTDP-4-amino-4,6-dideoxygalactose transaminase